MHTRIGKHTLWKINEDEKDDMKFFPRESVQKNLNFNRFQSSSYWMTNLIHLGFSLVTLTYYNGGIRQGLHAHASLLVEVFSKNRKKCTSPKNFNSVSNEFMYYFIDVTDSSWCRLNTDTYKSSTQNETYLSFVEFIMK